MDCAQNTLKNWALALFCFTVINHTVLSDPIWHCSRSDVQIADASDNFTLAALTLDREVIRISLRDLYAVYQGNAVKMSGGLPLSACVVSNDKNLTVTAMKSIGAQTASSTAMTSTHSLLTSNIHMVQDETAMLSCIEKHHPAIGYLSTVIHTEAVAPCF
jgi:hypothetical protein